MVSTELASSFTLSFSQLALLMILIIWSLVWKGIALWKAARKKSLPWFVILLIVNTAGILEIFYIFWLSNLKYK